MTRPAPLIVVFTESSLARARDRLTAELESMRDDQGRIVKPIAWSREEGRDGVTIELVYA